MGNGRRRIGLGREGADAVVWAAIMYNYREGLACTASRRIVLPRNSSSGKTNT